MAKNVQNYVEKSYFCRKRIELETITLKNRSNIMLMFIQLLVVLLALYVGSRYGSLALGAISGIGLAILVFGFGIACGRKAVSENIE